MQYIRSLLFIIQMYVMMPIWAVVFLPYALISPNGAWVACYSYAHYVRRTARWIVGLKTEIRGTPPTGEVMVAAKHQSFYDIMVIFSELPQAKFIMKRELLYAPILGQYAYRLGCIPVDRGKRGQAIQKMLEDVKKGQARPGQLVIYPQGTRVAPGDHKPYKVGSAVLYEQLSQDCIPVATNCGVFWPKRSMLRKQGNAVIEFLPTIEKGKDKEPFLAELEETIETHSNRLMEEAGFQVQ